MKAFSLKQPWATLVAIGAKQIETRSWKTDYRGPLAIHASKTWYATLGGLCLSWPFHEELERAGIKIRDLKRPAELPFGAVVATGRLREITRINPEFVHRLSWKEEMFGDYRLGRYAWLLEDVTPLEEPIPARGALGLWEWDGP